MRLALALTVLSGLSSPVLADPLPRKVGQCSYTTIQSIGGRLEGDPSSGSAVTYANGGAQVSYEVVKAIVQARRGDRVKLCLFALPQDCPKGDDRGKVYRATDLRTGGQWELPDSQHSCGGA